MEEGGWRSNTKAALHGMNTMDFKVVVWKDKQFVYREVEARNEVTLLRGAGVLPSLLGFEDRG